MRPQLRPSTILHALAVILIIAAGLYFSITSGALDVSPKTGIVMELPKQLMGLQGTEQEVSDAERLILPDDTQFAKMSYENDRELRINTQIVLAGAEKRSIHRPEVCLPGQGWTIKSSEVISVPMKTGKDLAVTMLSIAIPIRVGTETRELNQLFCYWFVGYETTTPSHLVRIAKTNLDVLLHNTNHRWAYVIVSAPILKGLVPGGLGPVETRKLVEDAIGELAPQIMRKNQSPELNASAAI